MRLWLYSFVLLWKTTSIFTVNLAKIDPKVLEKYRPYLLWPDVIVSFGSTQPALEAAKSAKSSATIAERARNIRSYLINLAQMEQRGVINLLTSRKEYQFESLWVSNRIFIRKVSQELVNVISDMANVTYIKEETKMWAIEEELHPTYHGGLIAPPSSNFNHNATKGLELIQAPEAWKVLGGASKAGEGVVVGVLDTGAYTGHETLSQNFVGMNYGFYDGTQQKSSFEAATMTHGTHITGTIVGRNGIGVAPGAKFSQCRACDRIYCFERAFESCIGFFICPTLRDGTQPDCSRRVHIIHLSFLDESQFIKPILDVAILAGIILVAPMGSKWYPTDKCNEGTYPGLFDEVIAVGFVNHTDQLDGRSSKGPNPNPNGNPKPDVVAPGVDVVSAHYEHPEYKYLTMTGSLTATAHATGLVALLLTRDKTLTQGQVRKLIIENTDRPHADPSLCANIPPNYWPNPEFGYGRINALKALNAQTSMLTGMNRNDSMLGTTCQQSFESYKERLNKKIGNVNSVNIEIRKDVQRSVQDFERLGHEINMFNATLRNLLNKAKKFENSFKSLEKN